MIYLQIDFDIKQNNFERYIMLSSNIYQLALYLKPRHVHSRIILGLPSLRKLQKINYLQRNYNGTEFN